MTNLREILEDLYDAGFFAAYPSKKSRVTVRREAITAAEEAIGRLPDPRFTSSWPVATLCDPEAEKAHNILICEILAYAEKGRV